MIVVFYKPKRGDGIKIMPFQNKVKAIKKADELYKKGFIGVRVVNLEEEIIYIPESN